MEASEREEYMEAYDETEDILNESCDNDDRISEDRNYWISGMSTVEVILIIAVLVGLVLIFKNQITALVTDIFNSITNNASKIY